MHPYRVSAITHSCFIISARGCFLRYGSIWERFLLQKPLLVVRMYQQLSPAVKSISMTALVVSVDKTNVKKETKKPQIFRHDNQQACTRAIFGDINVVNSRMTSHSISIETKYNAPSNVIRASISLIWTQVSFKLPIGTANLDWQWP